MRYIAIAAAIVISQVPALAKPTTVDISRLMNNDGIAAQAVTGKTGLDKGGYTYPADEIPAGAITVDGVTFKPIATEGKDNIACMGQTLKLPAGKYTKIHILTSAVNGSFIDYATITRSDKTSYKVDVAVTDWCVPAKYGEKQAVECSHRLAAKPDTVKCRIWMQTMHLKPTGKPAVSIKLPNDPQLHIFAVTVE